MNNTDNEIQTENPIRRQHRGQALEENKYAKLRNVLNAIFSNDLVTLCALS